MAPALDSLTAVILNWETPDYTIRSVEALIGDGLPASRIVVVDNGSRDDSFDRLTERLSGCVLRRLDENVGYGRAANFGVQALPGDAYLLLDNDAFVHRSGSVARLYSALRDPSVGLATPLVLTEGLALQPTVSPIQTPGVAFVRASGLSRLIPNRWQPRWSTHWDHTESREIQAVAGPVLLVRRKTWEELGGFDESVYLYADDLDFCWRVRNAGWTIWFCAEAVFTHVHSGSTRTHWGGAERAERVARSEAAMIRRHLPAVPAALSIGFASAGFAGRWLVFSALGRRVPAEAARRSLRGYSASN